MAAHLLYRLDLPAAARERMRAAAQEAGDERVRLACLRATIGIDLDWAFKDEAPDEDDPRWAWRVSRDAEGERAVREAVELLHGFMRAPLEPRLRWQAGHHLGLLCAVVPEARGWLAELLLRDVPPPDEAAREEASRWEARLRADDGEAREQAQDDLRVRGSAALQVLRALLGSSDPEVRARAQSVLETLALP